MPVSPDIQLQPHQARIRQQAEEAATAGEPFRRALIWQVGSGKGIGGLSAVDALSNRPTVIAPAALRPTLGMEALRALGRTDIPVVSYQGAAAGKAPVSDTYLIDEAHRLSSPGAQAKAVMDLAERARNVVVMTGTPIRNRPEEIAPLVSLVTGRHVDPDTFARRYVGFEQRRPGGFLGWLRGVPKVDVPTLQHADELKQLLQGKVDYYAPERPPVGVEEETHEVELSPRQADLYHGFWQRLPLVLRWKLKHRYDLSPQELAKFQAFMTGPRQVGLSDYPWRPDRSAAVAFESSNKLKKAYGELRKVLDSDPRTRAAVFSNFPTAGLVPYAAKLKAEGIPHAVFDGTLSDAERKDLVNRFNRGELRVALLGPAASEGISLRGAQVVQLLDPAWHEARMRQAAARVIRFDSHTDLPPELRKVKVQKFVGTLPLSMKDKLLATMGFNQRRKQETVDHYLVDLSQRKERLNRQLLDLLKEIGTPKQASELPRDELFDVLVEVSALDKAASRPVLVDLFAELKEVAAADRLAKRADETPPKVRHVVMIGHSGSGKSTIARMLSKRTGIPVYETDHDPEWIDCTVKDHPDHFTPGTEANEEYNELRKRLTDRALARPESHILVGCALMVDGNRLKGHRVILIDTPERYVVKQRVNRDEEEGKLKRDGEAKRKAKAWYLIQGLRHEVAHFRNNPDVEKVPSSKAERWVEEQPPNDSAVRRHVPTVAVDLDGTLAEHGPFKGKDHFHPVRPGAARFMKRLKAEGYRVIIYTCRGDEQAVRGWLADNDIPYDGVNKNPDQPPDTSDKLYAAAYVDDRSVHADGDWDEMFKRVKRRVRTHAYHEKKSVALEDSLELATYEKWARESAPGIPDRKNYGEHTDLPVNQLVTFLRQLHDARRAGRHYDVRVGTPETGLYSWATKKDFPQPGARPIALYRQPLHSHAYGDFQGTIPSGYGAGTVKTDTKGEALVTKVTPKEIALSLAHTGDPVRYTLRTTNDPKRWLMFPATPTTPVPYQKIHFHTTPQEQAEAVLKALKPGASVQQKIDGAAALVELRKDRPEITSYRSHAPSHPTLAGAPIVHTERALGGLGVLPGPVPKELVGSVLRGELYGVRPETGKAIPPQELGGLLNSGLAKSLRAQKERGIDLRTMLFDIQRHGRKPVGTDIPYAERLALLKDVLARTGLPQNKFHTPAEAKTPDEALTMWRNIREGRDPLTAEGVVVHPGHGGGRPTKIKNLEERDVYVRGVFPGRNRLAGVGAGGFNYSLTPTGPVLGEVGTGFSDETRRRMWESPASFVGRVARVRSQFAYPSGALRAPSFLALHEDVTPAKTAQLVVPPQQAPINVLLRQAKRLSDQGSAGDRSAYARKAQILHDLIAVRPEDWSVDSRPNPNYIGLTHVSGWKFHLPLAVVQDLVPRMTPWTSFARNPAYVAPPSLPATSSPLSAPSP